MQRMAAALLAIASIVCFQNCSAVRFSGSADTANAAGIDTQPANCGPALQTTTENIKLLFVVDVSGSNLTDPGTDPNKVMRAGSIQTFFNDYQSKTNFSWGFITFQDQSAQALINNGDPSVAAFSNADAMQTAISSFLQIDDEGSTPYRAALNMTSQAIANDPDLSSSLHPKYVVVFLSDGMPKDYPKGTEGDTELYSDVQALVDLAPDQISFNTIYYGPTNDITSGRLENMAKVGGGQFLDTNSDPAGKDFQISDVISVPGLNCN